MTYHNLQSHLPRWYTKICTLIRHTICESLVKMQYFRQEWSSILYENTQKFNKIKENSITYVYIWHANTTKYVYWSDTHSVNVWWRFVSPNTNVNSFCDIIFRDNNRHNPKITDRQTFLYIWSIYFLAKSN